MSGTSLRRLVSLRVSPATCSGPTLTLDVVESGTGRLLTDLPVAEPVGQNAFEVGDVLFSKLRPYLAKSYLVDRPIQGTGEFLPLVAIESAIDPRFLFYLTFSRGWLDHATMTAYGTKMPRTSWDAMADLEVWVPPLAEQHRIADFLDDQVARIDGAVLARRSQVQLAVDSWASVVEEAISDNQVPTTRLGRVARVQSGLTVNARQQSDSGGSLVPYLSVSNVKDGYLDLSVVKEATATSEQVERHRLRHGDVLMTEGGDLDKLGRGTVWEDQVHNCLHQNHVFAVRPDVTRLDPWYLTYQTQAGSARRHFMLTASKSTNLASTSASKVLDLPVLLPPIVEQQAVASLLRELRGTLDENLAVLRRSISLLTEYKQSLITAAVSGELDVTTAGKAVGS